MNHKKRIQAGWHDKLNAFSKKLFKEEGYVVIKNYLDASVVNEILHETKKKDFFKQSEFGIKYFYKNWKYTDKISKLILDISLNVARYRTKISLQPTACLLYTSPSPRD